LDFLTKKKFFMSNQYGFRKYHSTEHVLLAITNLAYHAIENNMVLIVVALDLRRAFPSVNRVNLINKLAEIGVDTALLADYLSSRTQSTKFKDELSDEICDFYGVPAGSCLGNLL